MKSKGQVLVERLERWISSWVSFPDAPGSQALIAALWTIHTWFAPRWPATAYAHITGDGPGVGKTILLEVLASLSCNPKVRATLRPLEVVRAIEGVEGVVTYFFDEVEKLAHAGASDMRSILTTGYRQGGKHGISVGQKSVEFSTYCAKAFASIGDLESVFRSRSIVFRLTWGVPARSWTDNVLVRDGEAAALLEAAKEVFQGNRPVWTPPAWMSGREREIWTPLYSVAVALGLDEPTMKRVRRAMDDFSSFKATAEARSYRDLVGSGDNAKDLEYARLALLDLGRVLPAADGRRTGHIASSAAVEAMRELDGPWRVYRGKGLDVDTLAGLVARFGVEPTVIREFKGRGKQNRGYRQDAVKAAVTKVIGG